MGFVITEAEHGCNKIDIRGLTNPDIPNDHFLVLGRVRMKISIVVRERKER